MKTINANEIKKRGISVVDEFLESQEPVQVIHRSKIKYVILKKDNYDDLVGEANVPYNADKDLKTGNFKKMNEVKEYEEKLWHQAAATSPAFDFLNDPEEDIYSLDDGEPFND